MKTYIVIMKNDERYVVTATSGNAAMNLICKQYSVLMKDIDDVKS